MAYLRSTSLEEIRSLLRHTTIIARTLAEMKAIRTAMEYEAMESFHRPARVGFVPTMGALHDGHISLCSLARNGYSTSTNQSQSNNRSDWVVSSVFVNPTQFAPTEDLAKYPRTWETDEKRLREQGVNVIFAPTAADMYPPPPATYRTFIEFKGFDTTTPEGAARPGFFRGVGTVVTKLLNIVNPTISVFGQKDGLQCIAIRTLVRDLNIPTHILIGPTSRESDGLARSSRNVYLTEQQRAAAPALYNSLRAVLMELETSEDGKAAILEAKQAAETAARSFATRQEEARKKSSSSSTTTASVDHEAIAAQAAAFAHSQSRSQQIPHDTATNQLLARLKDVFTNTLREKGAGEFGDIEYIEFNDALTGERLQRLQDSKAKNGAVLLSTAVKIGKTRLIDNLVLIGNYDDLGAAPGEYD